jgi:CHAT domain-containing protein
MGRWIESDNILLPPRQDCAGTRLSVFAAEMDSPAHAPHLEWAIKEREDLADRWDGVPLRASKEVVEELLDQDPKVGHFAHFAVHGISDPTANRQHLILEGNKRLTVTALVGAYRCGEVPPRFSFVFLNACQVGTPGSELGEVAGFPGGLVRGGVTGVVAPLWDVDDELAYAGAVRFYENVFDKGKSVAEALREWRRDYGKGPTTPIAYTFYGHPNLKLRKPNGETPERERP